MTLQISLYDSYINAFFGGIFFVLQVEERIPKASKKPLLMDALRPAHTQDEKSELAVERTPESEGKRSDTLQENTEHFFVTQVCACTVSVIFPSDSSCSVGKI